ncbi:MAG: TIGR03905 family TSCPD domain-containing protein [Erysipelotrichaceae bacterium]|nr:TIGR03905 family TSCPD domain-containing protein [Erysipelotrichaceae bacterium]
MTFFPKGVCSRQYDIQYEDNKIVDIQIIGGCNGNLKGLRALLIGMDIDEAINKLSGITCGPRQTSCPDQIARALKSIKR